ncbi:MAG: hypothetical protein MK086_09770, partial [Flavobacteriales bacterium]|nr:hypothetical protein [Flavobacteriales bacterium]
MRDKFLLRYTRRFLSTLTLTLLSIYAVSQEVDLDNTMTVDELVEQVLLGNGVSVSNITFNGAPGDQVNVQIGRFFGTSNLVEFPEAVM